MQEQACNPKKILGEEIIPIYKLYSRTDLIDLLERSVLNNASSVQEILFDDSSCYRGQVQHNQKHGKGIYYYANKEIYCGDWQNDLFFGQGTYLFENHDVYQGEFANGLIEGMGIYYYHNCDIYKGNF